MFQKSYTKAIFVFRFPFDRNLRSVKPFLTHFQNKMENVKRESIRPKNNVEDEPNIISLARTNKKQSEYIDGMHLPLFDLQQFKRQYL